MLKHSIPRAIGLLLLAGCVRVYIYPGGSGQTNAVVMSPKLSAARVLILPGGGDDTSTLQAALNTLGPTNGTVKIAAGHYRITDTLRVPVQARGYSGGFTIEGDSFGSTEIQADMCGKPALDLGPILFHPTVRNLRIVGRYDRKDTTGVGIRTGSPIQGAAGEGVHLDSLWISGFAVGAQCSNAWGIVIENCRFASNHVACVQLVPGYYWRMQSCDFQGGPAPGWYGNSGVEILPAGGVQGLMECCRFLYFTNAVVQRDCTVNYLACEWENCGASVWGSGLIQSKFIGCGTSELFHNINDWSLTNGHLAPFIFDGVAAHGLSIDLPTTELDMTVLRPTVWIYPTNQSFYDFSGDKMYVPNYANGAAGYLRGVWGTLSSNVSFTIPKRG